MLAGLSWSMMPSDAETIGEGDDYTIEQAQDEAAAAWEEPSARGRVLLELGAHLESSSDGLHGYGGWLGVTLPFDRLWTPRSRGSERGAIEQQAPPGKESSAVTRARSTLLSPTLARACVSAAWRAAGVATMADLDSMCARARTSGLLPEARFRASRSWDRGQKLTPTDSDPYRLQDSTSATQWLEGRLTWRLDRLVFADEEVAVEKLRAQRAQQRAQVAGKVLAALFEWQRARRAAEDAGLTDAERGEAWIRASEAEAALDVLTGGWFSSWLESQGR